MNKRASLATVLLALVLAACGREGGTYLATVDTESTPSPTSSAAVTSPGVTATPAASAGASAAPGTSAAPAASNAPAASAAPAAEGSVNRPKNGRYVYALSGESSDPFNPSGPPQKLPSDAQGFTQVSSSGNVVTESTTNSEAAGRQTTKSRWEATKISLLSFNAETQAGTFGCELNPPVVIANIPIKPGLVSNTSFKGTGNACSGGKISITVERKETVKDAGGRSYSTWRIKVHLETSSPQISTVQDETRWFSPDLGANIRSNATTVAKVAALGNQAITQKTQSTLKSHP